jgi:hypothetical protein
MERGVCLSRKYLYGMYVQNNLLHVQYDCSTMIEMSDVLFLAVLLQCPIYSLWNRCLLSDGLSILLKLRGWNKGFQGSPDNFCDIPKCDHSLPSKFMTLVGHWLQDLTISLIVASGCHIRHVYLSQRGSDRDSTWSSYVRKNSPCTGSHLDIRTYFNPSRLSGTIATIAICRSVLDLRTAAELAGPDYTDDAELTTVTQERPSQPRLPGRISTSGDVPVFIVTDSMATSEGPYESSPDHTSQSRGEVWLARLAHAIPTLCQPRALCYTVIPWWIVMKELVRGLLHKIHVL